MPYLLAVAMTWSSRMEPPGSAMYCTPDFLARSTLSPKGKKASEPQVTPDWSAIQAFFSSAVRTSGFTAKVFCHTPSASTSSYSSERYTSMALSRSGRRMPSTNCSPSTLG